MQDRGTIKWTSLMLPEHVKLLDDLYKQQEHKQKPILDEQQMEEINMKLQLAHKDDLQIKVSYYREHDFHDVKGRFSISGDMIIIDDLRIKFSDVMDVEIL